MPGYDFPTTSWENGITLRSEMGNKQWLCVNGRGDGKVLKYYVSLGMREKIIYILYIYRHILCLTCRKYWDYEREIKSIKNSCLIAFGFSTHLTTIFASICNLLLYYQRERERLQWRCRRKNKWMEIIGLFFDILFVF